MKIMLRWCTLAVLFAWVLAMPVFGADLSGNELKRKAMNDAPHPGLLVVEIPEEERP